MTPRSPVFRISGVTVPPWMCGALARVLDAALREQQRAGAVGLDPWRALVEALRSEAAASDVGRTEVVGSEIVAGSVAADEVGVDEAATRLQITPRRVRQLLAEDRLGGRKAAGRWLVDPGSIHELAKERER
mgnify:CR=1 FL=1